MQAKKKPDGLQGCRLHRAEVSEKTIKSKMQALKNSVSFERFSLNVNPVQFKVEELRKTDLSDGEEDSWSGCDIPEH